MRILILAAMDKEVQLIKNILENAKCENVNGNLPIIRGSINGHTIYVGKCGIGKVNAAVNTLLLINTLHPDLILNSGVAGGAGLPIGSVLVADNVAYDDVWCGPGTTYGQADNNPLFFTPYTETINLIRDSGLDRHVVFGLICSGDKFISSCEEIAFIRSHFPDVKAVDMESAAIAHVCHMTSTPFNIIRVVSDTPGEGENISQYKDFWVKAPEKTFTILKDLIQHI